MKEIICPNCKKPIECLSDLPGLRICSKLTIKCDQCEQLVEIEPCEVTHSKPKEVECPWCNGEGMINDERGGHTCRDCGGKGKS
jgi:DnaJ-class molecular chaperone